jgi:ABC-2 type transport system ATP-binding protein
MTIVVAESVTKRYGETLALDGVSLSVAEGETVALIGPNGAGKTTFVRTLTGTTAADSGTLSLFDSTPSDVDRSRVGLLPQDFDPAERLTPRELVTYYGGLYDAARDTASVLSDVGLPESHREKRYEALSGGQQRRVCVACTLVNQPDALFLDEPTTGVDPAGRRSIWSLLEELAGGGTTVLLTTHDMAEAERLADRVVLLDAGSVVATGRPEDLIAEHGGAPSLSLSFEGDSGAEVGIPDGVLTALENAGYDAEDADGQVVVHGIDAVDVGGVVDAAESAGATVTALDWHQPTLEDVYLELAETSLDGVEPGDTAARAGSAAAGGDR